MIDVIGVLMEGRPDLHGVAVGSMHAVVPIAEIPGGRVEATGLHVGVIGVLRHHIAVIDELGMVGGLAVGAVPPWVEDQF